ncbi:MAG: helix-hairpin-helix domain-containing protein [Saccharofermentans sp.]|nr:helix-hairpin-helix domain-containing protein [Saccharofermentans sp.]
MVKKSTASKIKSLIYPLAFILVIILSALYKFVFKGNGDFSIKAFKSGKTASVSDVSGADNTVITGSDSVNVSYTDETYSTVTETFQMISVYICGEVKEPGIYEVPKGALLNDIIEDAGGLTEEASVNNINFVYRIEYNISVYIPSKDEVATGFAGGDIIRQDGVYVWGSSSGGAEGGGQGETLMVNINTASVDELKSLPGIGEVTAKAIADYRKNEPFKSIEDIKNVTGIGDSKFNRIKDYICV